ncbi:GNAT family N-acetyltransferase [Paenibacillus sp. N1-5-1-14]|uniref:GNAT family N-acetyltransferase n=1 Tax=Paenibacillus radicibacter TaxID=2972488 RepID=UPI00215939CB|nr:GNAT family N-acetyltransferase [Paenibacillus radicibacter]MCR8643263.1 GNAT family N-acetyltransferase [Paenibacillus radicibacter]
MMGFANKERGHSYLEVRPVTSGTEAGRVSDFLLGKDCFDDQNFTPGEIEQLRWLPIRSLQEQHVFCWFEEDEGRIVSAIIFVENEHRSGGYRFEYFGVHKAYRHRKLGYKLLDAMFQFCQSRQGRYIETFTCDLPEYESARKMFERNGFKFMSHLPEYYYPGEGKLLYLKLFA